MNWIPAFSSTAVLAIIGFMLSVPYRKAIISAFDAKLEETKAQFRRDEEVLRAELRSRDAQIDALRSGALSSLAARHAEMGRRRIQAVEKIWSHVIESSNLKMISKFAENLRIEEMLKNAEQSTDNRQKMRVFAETILKSANADEPKEYNPAADKERPFVSEITWAYFTAYRQLLVWPFVRLQFLKSGVSKSILADPSRMAEVLKTALPHQTPFIEEHGPDSFSLLVEELEQTLLNSLRNELNQAEADEKAVAQAARIIAAVDKVMRADAVEPPALDPVAE